MGATKELATSFISSLPMIRKTLDVSAWLSGLYKLIAKVLANRLKMVVGKIDFEFLISYVKEIQIVDATLVANVTIDSTLKGGSAGLICKLDIEMT